MEELRNAIKEKMDWSLDRMIRTRDRRLIDLKTPKTTLTPLRQH